MSRRLPIDNKKYFSYKFEVPEDTDDLYFDMQDLYKFIKKENGKIIRISYSFLSPSAEANIGSGTLVGEINKYEQYVINLMGTFYNYSNDTIFPAYLNLEGDNGSNSNFFINLELAQLVTFLSGESYIFNIVAEVL